MNSIRNLARAGVLLLALALTAAACSGTASTTIAETDESAAQADDAAESTQAPEPTAEPAPTQAPEPTAVPEPTPEPEPEPTATPEPVQTFWATDLEPGMCINRVEGNPSFVPPEVISCDDFHEEEIYAKSQLDFAPGEPYPGEDTLVDLVSTQLCDDATIEFAGETWDLLPFDTFIGYPVEEEWDAGDRNVVCTAAPPEGVAFKIGTAAGGTLDTDDVVLARTSLNNDGERFEDWVVLSEHDSISTLGSLTNGDYDIPLRRPSVTDRGFVFAAHQGGEGAADSIFGYDWETGDITDFGGFEDGSEFGGVLFAADGKTVLAARETTDSDWDLWMAVDETGFFPLVAGSGDQRFPSLTPDGTEVVYQDSGNLWIVDTNGGEPRQLTDSPANDFESTVSPDGSTVVFASDRSGNDDLWAISIDGGEPVNLTNHPGDDIWPVFNEDGSLIYFSSDRLNPIDDRSKVMVMEADGSNQSWFAIVDSAQAELVPQEWAQTVRSAAPTLDERYNYDQVSGEPGTTVAWTHSSGRLSAELPAGWFVGEFDEQVGFLVAARPSEYFETWATDGATVTLYDGETADSFFPLFDQSPAVQCEQFDGTDGVIQFEPGILGETANHMCGEGSVGGVIALYNTETGVGVLIEGQTDGLPSAEADAAMITAFAQSLVWS